MKATHPIILVGSYTNTENKVGIRALEFNPTTATFHLLSQTKKVKNPSYLAKHPQLAVVYAIQECSEEDGAAVLAFNYDEAGHLTLVNQQAIFGSAPCHVAVDPTGRYLATAQYVGGSISFHKLNERGELIAGSQIVKHQAAGKDSHAHGVVFDTSGQRLYVSDLGLDQVLIYDINEGRLEPAEPPVRDLHEGAGPRHVVLHPRGFAFVVNELDSSLSSYRLQAGNLEFIETVSALPPNIDVENSGAALRLHPNGRFLYTSNRGHDSVSVFAVDETSGKLSFVSVQRLRGRWPRDIAFDTTGAFLFVANQHSDTLETYQVNAETGRLEPVGEPFAVPVPVCVLPV